MITPYQMDNIKKKFFQYSVNTKRMAEITPERLEEIKEDIKFFDEKIYTKPIKGDIRANKLERYYRAASYIIGRRDYTFDERAAFLIMASDPELVMYKGYKALDLTSNKVIEEIEDDKERISAVQRNELIIDEYASEVRNQIGFYEPKLVKFEEMFFKKFVKEFIPHSGKDFGNELFLLRHSFDKITPADYLQVKDAVKKYKEEVENIDIKTAIYHILFQNNLLGLRTNEQLLLFFILVIDPELDFYQIYLEESMWDKIEERTLEEKGYFNKYLYVIERDYDVAFNPEDKRKRLW